MRYRKILLLSLFVIYINVTINAMPNFGMYDSSYSLKEHVMQLGGSLSFVHGQAYFYTTGKPQSLTSDSPYHVFINIASQMTGFVPLLLLYFLPRTYVSYQHKWGLRKNAEFSFAAYLISPIPIIMNVLGPGIALSFGYKKTFFSKNDRDAAYKFTGAIGYNGMPGVDISVTNSLLFGRKLPEKYFTFIFSLQNGISYITPEGWVISQHALIAVTVDPGFEFSWSREIGKNSLYIFSFFFHNEFSFEIAGYSDVYNSGWDFDGRPIADFSLGSYFETGVNFSWQKIITKGKK